MSQDATSEAVFWLSRLIVPGTLHTADRLACEMAVDLRTVRRRVAGQLTPSASSIMHMRTLWLLRQAAPNAAQWVWGTSPEQLETLGRSLVMVARDPEDVRGRERRRVEYMSLTKSGPGGGA